MRRGFWAGLGVGAAAVALTLGLTACVSKTVTIPYGSEASCSVVVPKNSGK